MNALITRGDMILPVLLAAEEDELPETEAGTVVNGRDVTDLVQAMYHSGLLYGVGDDDGDRWRLTRAGRLLCQTLLADDTLTEEPA